MKYLTSHGQGVKGLLDALHIPYEGVSGVRLIIEPGQVVRVEVERCVTTEEMQELTQWVLRQGIEAEQIDD